jgi:glycosyltransferase involved in cell wall biosynthesis
VKTRKEYESVDILMPLTGDGPYLEAAIRSCLAQSNVDVQIIVIWEKITEKALALLENLASENENILILESKGKGVSTALNTGIEISKSKYLARADSDDIQIEDRLAKQINYLQSKRVACVGGQVIFIDSEGRNLGHSRFPVGPMATRKALRWNNCLAHGFVLMQREAINSVGFYNCQYEGAEDYELWARISQVKEISNLPNVVGFHRIHNAQSQILRRKQIIEMTRKVRYNFAKGMHGESNHSNQVLLSEFVEEIFHHSPHTSRIQAAAYILFAAPRYGTRTVVRFFLDKILEEMSTSIHRIAWRVKMLRLP